jgi:hypothetical protein
LVPPNIKLLIVSAQQDAWLMITRLESAELGDVRSSTGTPPKFNDVLLTEIAPPTPLMSTVPDAGTATSGWLGSELDTLSVRS